MKSESLFEQACQALEVARRDWEAANAKITAMIWDQHLYRTAIDARLEAAKRWTEASMKRNEILKNMGREADDKRV